MALLSLRIESFPQFNVTPKDWKGFFLYFLVFLFIFVFGSIMSSAFGEGDEVNGALAFVGFLLTAASVVFNVVITAAYYYSFIRNKLKLGYVINDAEQRAVCEAAGVYKDIDKATNKKGIIWKAAIEVFCAIALLAVLLGQCGGGSYGTGGGVALTKEADFAVKMVNDNSGVRVKGPRTENKESITKMVIPSTIEGESVTSVWGAFNGCINLQYVSMPDTVKNVSRCANLKLLKSVRLPSTLRRIEQNMFMGCLSLEDVNIPDTVEQIDESAFEDCASLKSIKLPSRLNSIGYYAFRDCASLKTIEFPALLEAVEPRAFSGCTSLEDVVIPDENMQINFVSEVFRGCSALPLKIQVKLKKIGYKGSF